MPRCSRDKYAYLSNFRWYTGVLIDLSRVEGSKHGDALALQLTDVSLRVEEVREYAVHKSVGLLLEPSLITVSFAVLGVWLVVAAEVVVVVVVVLVASKVRRLLLPVLVVFRRSFPVRRRAASTIAGQTARGELLAADTSSCPRTTFRHLNIIPFRPWSGVCCLYDTC